MGGLLAACRAGDADVDERRSQAKVSRKAAEPAVVDDARAGADDSDEEGDEADWRATRFYWRGK